MGRHRDTPEDADDAWTESRGERRPDEMFASVAPAASPSLTALQVEKDSTMPDDQGAVAQALLPSETVSRLALALEDLSSSAEVVRRMLHQDKERQGQALREIGIPFTGAIDRAKAALRAYDAARHQPPVSPAEQVESAAIDFLNSSVSWVPHSALKAICERLNEAVQLLAPDQGERASDAFVAVLSAQSVANMWLPTPPAEGSGR